MKSADSPRSPCFPRIPLHTLRALVAATALGFLTPLHAQPPAGTAAPGQAGQSGPSQAARQLHGEYTELQKRLGMIQEKAVKAHPELEQQSQALETLIMSKMKLDGGKNPKDEIASLGGLEQKLGSKSTSESERQALMSEYRERANSFRDAQLQALRDPEVQKAQAALVNATVAAMKEQDPKTEELLQQLQQKQAQLRKMMESSGQPR